MPTTPKLSELDPNLDTYDAYQMVCRPIPRLLVEAADNLTLLHWYERTLLRRADYEGSFGPSYLEDQMYRLYNEIVRRMVGVMP